MATTHQTHIDIWCDHGELHGCPVEFTYAAEHEPADPENGYFHDTWAVSGQIASITIGGLKLDRAQFLALTDRCQLDSRETYLAEEVQALFECGDLPSYQHAAE